MNNNIEKILKQHRQKFDGLRLELDEFIETEWRNAKDENIVSVAGDLKVIEIVRRESLNTAEKYALKCFAQAKLLRVNARE